MHEHFKPPRPTAKVFECARRLLGKGFMLEYMFSKKYPQGGRYGDQWYMHVMLTAYAQGDVQKEWKKVGSIVRKHDATDPPVGSGGVEPMLMTPSGHDILYALDGFTTWTCRDVRLIGNLVYVDKGEVLPTYIHVDCNKTPSSPDVSRQHYIMITGPCGVLGCFAMKTGTRLWKGRDKHLNKRRKNDGSAVLCDASFKYWYDYIPEKLEACHLPGQEDPNEVRDKMASREWLVRS